MSHKWTDQEVIDILKGDSLLNHVRREVVACAGRLEQMGQQRQIPSIFDQRRVELEYADRIIKLFIAEGR